MTESAREEAYRILKSQGITMKVEPYGIYSGIFVTFTHNGEVILNVEDLPLFDTDLTDDG
jgi:hypothetical protein